MTEDVSLLTPRTADEPMAFTRDEFWRGAMRAWGAFLVLLLIGEIVASVVSDVTYAAQSDVAHMSSVSILPIVLGMSLLIGGTVSGASLLLGIPLARRMATALRRQRRISVHVACYAVFGFVFGGVIGAGTYALAFFSSSVAVALEAVLAVGAIAGALTSVAVTGAWWTIVRRALREDQGRVRRRRRERRDLDALAEDAL